MGKKKVKSKKNDSRGYQQTTSTTNLREEPAIQNVKIGASTQEQLDRLLSLLDADEPTVSPVDLPTNLLLKKVGKLYYRLVELGFTLPQIEKVVGAGQISLDEALDWLLLHLPTSELPVLFTEGDVRDEDTSSKDISVVIHEKQHGSDQKQQEAYLSSDVFETDPDSSDRKNELENDAARRALIVEQYGYYEEDDQVDSLEEEGTNCALDQPSDDDLQLRELEAELNETEETLADEGANYMRSKYEVKELQQKVKRLHKMIVGIKRKMDKKQKETKANQARDTVDGTKEAEDLGLLGMFDEDAINDSTSQQNITILETLEDNQENDRMKIPKECIPKGWTGQTPKQILEERCRKEKKSQPIFEKLGRSGCRLRLKDFAIEFEHSDEYARYIDIQHYLSTKALYHICRHLPLYGMLPPFFRDLWVSWLRSEAEDIEVEKQQESKQNKSTIERLVQLIPRMKQDAVQLKEPPLEYVDRNVDYQAVWDEEDEFDVLSSKRIQFENPLAKRLETKEYQDMLRQRQNLPINAYRGKILSTIDENPVTIICAETGAGKTTQCPQFILENELAVNSNSRTSIICTQPRRVAATSIARRVSQEMCEKSVGNLVGYQIRLESCKSSETRLLYCTTGVVLRKLVEDPTLSGITHVIVDEVHERQWQIDLLLVSLRQLLITSRPNLKIILMSATMDSNLFSQFFSGAPVLSIPGRSYPVSSYYLEDIIEGTGHIIEEGSYTALKDYANVRMASFHVTQRGGGQYKETLFPEEGLDLDVSNDFPDFSLLTRRSMDRVDETKINYDLIEDVLKSILLNTQDNSFVKPPEGVNLSCGAVLIFLPGIGEIKTLMERLKASREFGNKRKFDIIPLHSSLSSEEQQLAFRTSRSGIRNIILSTNIAETSVTVSDVVFVIDSGRVREIKYDKRTGTRKLLLQWCSRASANQRKGRAGRVQPGVCLKLYSTKTEKYEMRPTTEPEMKRIPLDEVCLTILASGLSKNCLEFLRQTPQPPDDSAIYAALRILEEVGAVLPSTGGRSETLTPLGRHLSNLPIDYRLGKILIYAALFLCFDTCATIVAFMSASKSPFALPLKEKASVDAARLNLYVEQSDFLTYAKLWEQYEKADQAGIGIQFCHHNYLNVGTMREIQEARKQFYMFVASIGFIDKSLKSTDGKYNSYNKNGKSQSIIHSVIAAGMYPNIAVRDREATRECSFWSKDEQLYIHSSSVNSTNSIDVPSSYLTYYEKFNTGTRTYITTTAFVHPFALLLFGGDIHVEYIERMAVIDGWIRVHVSGKTAVIFRKLRDVLNDKILATYLSNASVEEKERIQIIVDAIVRLICTS